MSIQKLALVTGANKGIGFAVSRQLAQKGIKVLMSARDISKGKVSAKVLQDQNLDVESIKLDVANSSDIINAKKYIEEKYGKLDILINNAGATNSEEQMFGNSVETVSVKSIKQIFEINFFAQIELTQALLPLLKKSNSARIVNVSSILGSCTIQSDFRSNFSGAKPFSCDASKTALNQFTIHLAHALKDTTAKVNSAHPGWVKTDLGTDAAPMTPDEGAITIVNLATLDDNGPTGKFFHFDKELPW